MYKISDLKIGWFFFFQLKICRWFGKKIALQNYFYLDRIQYLNYPSWKIPIVWSLYPQLCHSCVIMMYCIVNNPFFKILFYFGLVELDIVTKFELIPYSSQLNVKILAITVLLWADYYTY